MWLYKCSEFSGPRSVQIYCYIAVYVHLVGILEQWFTKVYYFCQGQPLVTTCHGRQKPSYPTGSGLFIIQLIHRRYSSSTMGYRIGPCVTLLLSESNWTVRDIAIVRQQLDHA
jgi:hypothetical protein